MGGFNDMTKDLTQGKIMPLLFSFTVYVRMFPHTCPFFTFEMLKITKRRCLKMAKAGHERQHLFPQHFWAIENRVQKEQHSRIYFHKEFQVE